MIVAGIETSCDETSVAIVKDDKTILSNMVLSQIETHKKFGGVVPEIAARAHLDAISKVFDIAIEQAGISISQIDAIAATCGPGLIGGVIVGSSFAKGIAIALNKPFIPVNHLIGHALTPRLTNKLDYPYLLLLASGGHCIISEILGPNLSRTLGQTIDDSAGECFDKVAKMLAIPYPGGPKIEQLAKSGDPLKFKLPLPLCNKKNCNFSFSGLKTAVLYTIKDLGERTDQEKNNLCASFQETITKIFINKLKYAIEIMDPNISSIAFAGGVSANQYINNSLKDFSSANNLKFYNAPIGLCTDNGAMIAWCGIEQFDGSSRLDFAPRSTWPL